MSKVQLPKGWQSWPEAQQMELLSGLEALVQEREAGRGPWLCDREVCDGKPHPGRRNPHSRSEQRPPQDDEWDNWLLLAGRGFGKTRTGAEWAIEQARTQARGALVGATAADTRDILVEGESGIMACAPVSFRPVYEPSKRRVTYPNGAVQTLYSADEPDRLRGPQHHYAWLDELAAWRRLQYAWDMLQMGLRLGAHPRACITTTPRPLPLVKHLVKSERSAVVRGSTYDNLHNLAPTFRRAVLDRYAGTVLGRQELDAEILEDLPGALVRRKDIEENRVEKAPDLDMILVGVDPSGTGTGDEAGIIVVGRGTADRHAYVLADLSGQLSARQTGLLAWQAFYDHKADALVYEDNFGKQWLRDGLIDAYADHHNLDRDMRNALKDERTADTVSVPSPWKFLKKVTAQHGKKLRAQPVAMRYEQGRVHHVGVFLELEDQLTTWNPDEDGKAGNDSPDRIDALVHAATYLLKRERSVGVIATPHRAGLGSARGPVRPPMGMNRRFGT
jgi:phage terminase large subunit-like protein